MSPSNAGVRILVVDDDPDTARTLSELLCRVGFGSQSITDANLAVDAVRRFLPHVMLLDLAMPGQDGFEVMRQVRQDPAIAATVIVVSSGHSEESDREAAFAAGADHFLPKPLSLQTIREIATVAAERARARSG